MILVNTDYISGKELEMLGIVKGSTIHSKHIGKDISQAFKTLVGGELTAYNEMMNELSLPNVWLQKLRPWTQMLLSIFGMLLPLLCRELLK